MNITFQDLRRANLKRLPLFKNRRGEPAHTHPQGFDWPLSKWSNATLGELGEAANIIKKIERGDFTAEEEKKAIADLADEIADAQTYLDLLALRAGINLDEALVKKFNEISRRVGCEVFIG